MTGDKNENRPRHTRLPAGERSRAALGGLLERILRTIIHLPWLGTNAGGIFLKVPGEARLELAAHVNFSPFIQGSCAQVAFGHCLCGRVAASGELLHVGCVDHRHDVRYEGMTDHGHYVVPIRSGDELLGVMTLYVEVGHCARADEIQVLEDFAETIANLILAMRIRNDKALADLILEHSAHGVMITDARRRIEWVNPAFEEITGYRLEEVRGRSPSLLRSDIHDEAFFSNMRSCIEREGHWEGEIWNRHRDGSYRPQFLSIVALRDEEGEVVRYAGMLVDLSDIRRAEQRIHQLAFYDKVTGLPNAEHFQGTLSGLLHDARGDARPVLVLILDLDHFHEINEGLGHRIGNRMLREVAERLRRLPGGPFVARLGADQFAVALQVPHTEACKGPDHFPAQLAGMLQEALAAPLQAGHQTIPLNCTVGIALSEAGETDAEAVIQRAMVALRYAKNHARGGFRVYDETVGEQVEFARFVSTHLARAIGSDELFLVYQPQVRPDGRLHGAEALLRWDTARYGRIPPDRFIPLAEERGHIIEIGLWAFESAVETYAEWRRRTEDPDRLPRLAINVSPVQLMYDHLAQDLCEICLRHEVPSRVIEIEVTETGLMHLSERVVSHLHELAEAGFHIAIDDFGTGFSSLARLHQFPLDVLKIDRSFIADMTGRKGSHALVRSIIDMAHALGYEVVAEGVEMEEQFLLLRRMGCGLFQGYLFGRPVAADEFHASWIAPRAGDASAGQSILPLRRSCRQG